MAIPTTKEEILKTGEIDPELAELLKSIPPLSFLAGKPEDIRAGMAAMMEKEGREAMAPLLANIDVRDTTVPARDGHQIPVKIYTPHKAPQGGSPLVLLIHGGGFIIGAPELETVNASLACEKLGCVVVNVDYRLAPEHKFPVGVNDCWDALQWTAANASSLGATPSVGFLVGGTSAGGNLAAVLSYLARDTPLNPPLTGTFLSVPMVLSEKNVPEKYAPHYLSMQQNATAPIITYEDIQALIGYYKPEEDSPLYSPFTHPKGHKGLPPTYIQVCGMDPLRDDGLLYEKLLREEAGVKTRLDVYEGLPHAFWSVLPMLSRSAGVGVDTLNGLVWLLEEGKR